MIRRLYLRVYLTTLASLAVVVILCALLWGYTAERSGDPEPDPLFGALVGSALPANATPAQWQATLQRLVLPPVEGIAVFDRDGVRRAAAGRLDHLERATIDESFHARMIVGLRSYPLDGGRVVVVRVRTDAMQLHLRGLVLIGLIALAVALATYPVARQLTRRLERLAGTVDRFGHGDLAVRAQVSGNDEVSSLATRFNGMADRVGDLLDAHRRMLMNASHELRSPLARIRMALELYASDPRPDLLQGLRADCAEIDGQIEEILLASKLETVDTVVATDVVDLEALLAEEASRLDIPFDSVPAEVRGDARLLRRLLRNLLENALKHGGTGVDANLSIAANGERIARVSDRGPGIPEAERERIFEPFYRPTRSAENGSGWGLGLALVRQIADHHHGSVRCLAREGGGCVFELRLPAP